MSNSYFIFHDFVIPKSTANVVRNQILLLDLHSRESVDDNVKWFVPRIELEKLKVENKHGVLGEVGEGLG